ncbi:MAG: glycerophosphoryl diester phosphodiesterase membrane domain-containing protein [Sphingomonas sp.]|nr:glycerophosphoryl diester phosphodiesterase membrane domain-containing protein [Sphingomonas sp.]
MANLSITTAWNETAGFVAREARLLFPLAFMLVALPVAALTALTPAPAGPAELPPMGLWTLAVPVALIASTIGNIAISHLALRPGASVGEGIARGTARFLTLIVAVIVLVVALIAAFFIVAMIVMALVPGAMAGAQSGMPTPELETATWLMMALMLPLVILLAARLLVMTPAAAAEQGGPLALMRRSWTLTSGHSWKLIGFILLVSIALGVLGTAIQSVVGLVAALLIGPLAPGSLSMLIVILAMAGVNTVIGAYLATLLARIYAQLAGTA